MRQKEEKALRLALILLAASISVVQLVGIPAGMGNAPAKGTVLVADGPLPRPGPPTPYGPAV
jgi:hypothetical protein